VFAEFLGAMSAIAHHDPLTMAWGLTVLGPKEDAVLAALEGHVTEPGR